MAREREETTSCADCGALIDLAGARTFAFGEQAVLCWSCALRRGGRYDAGRESWTTPPSVAGLEDAED